MFFMVSMEMREFLLNFWSFSIHGARNPNLCCWYSSCLEMIDEITSIKVEVQVHKILTYKRCPIHFSFISSTISTYKKVYSSECFLGYLVFFKTLPICSSHTPVKTGPLNFGCSWWPQIFFFNMYLCEVTSKRSFEFIGTWKGDL